MTPAPVTPLSIAMEVTGTRPIDLARATRLTKQTIWKLQNGRQAMTAEKAEQIAPALGLPWPGLLDLYKLRDPEQIAQKVRDLLEGSSPTIRPPPQQPADDGDELARLTALWPELDADARKTLLLAALRLRDGIRLERAHLAPDRKRHDDP